MFPVFFLLYQPQYFEICEKIIKTSPSYLNNAATILLSTDFGPSCFTQINTRVSYKSGFATWTISGVIAFIGCIFGCCLIPFFVDSCKDKFTIKY
ncbi:Lipopolysaccharide-induced tumor necrosis factor-alpha factor [Brachionus plicatilis]|uniref:Lipopolysaccharide-induced tumor necrosis factor-alpha factor n=1 Tax=Brachionus plicatilis TaxID=10195 RepID=A0A3M7SKA2_BRAPC|nr:Lipopolysaccharide-induced tumor necrosis factor-alpha factor [Brachionus plicatilis]